MFKTNTQSLQPLPKPVLNHAILGRHIHIYPISESDINSTYVSWLKDPETSEFIEGGGKENNLKSVREYIVSHRKKGLEVFALKTSKDQKFIGTVGIINLDPLATTDDGSCILPDGCTDPLACNYDISATCDDGSCLTDYGCMNPAATNYDPLATCPDSCIFPVVTYGCTDSTAYNYNPTATIDDTSCCFIAGCTDALAFNYDITACYDDGSCIPITLGCTYQVACNYDASANSDDGSCIFPDGCTDDEADNYDPTALCDDGSCKYSTAINEEISGLLMYPNPANNVLTIVSHSVGIENINIYNLNGQLVLNKVLDNHHNTIILYFV